ncbi:MAG: hypothetical protein AB7C89_00465 [Intestinibacillus sp.]
MKKQKSFKNTLKNAALVVLTLLLAVLISLTWSTGLSRDDIPLDSPFARLYALLPFADSGYVQRAGDTPAAYPSGIAMTAADGLRGAFYNEAAEGGLYDMVRPLWAAALVEARGFESAAVDDLRAALSGEDTLLLSYNGSLPLSLLAGWMGADGSRVAEYDVNALVLTRSGMLFVRDGSNGRLYRTQERMPVNEAVWEKTAEGVSAPLCAYAGTLEQSDYGSLLPETLVPSAPAAYDILQTRIPAFGDPSSGDSLQTLLGAFGYDPYVQSYTENDGTTQVFVENFSSLRVSREGVVNFKANSLNGALPVYQEGEAGRAEAIAAQIDYAHEVLSAALGAIGSVIPAELQSIQYDSEAGICNLEFAQAAGGVMIRRQDAPLARFTFQGGVLVAAELSLRDYTPTGEKLFVLPVRQAAAALRQDGRRQYLVAYTDVGSGRLTAAAYSRDWGSSGAVG